jgi:hypothetical protein
VILSSSWQSPLHTDPLPGLLEWKDPALQRQTGFDLLGEGGEEYQDLWALPEVEKLIKKQGEDGSWKYSGKTIDPQTGTNYFLLETYRSLRVLVETYRLDRRHPAIERAAEYVYSCQTAEGDIRGIIGNQYMPYYHGAILELLIKAGYAEESRTITGLDWLLSMRQEDGGWVVPTQQVPSAERTTEFWLGEPVQPDSGQPHAHLATGMVLRAFAAHPRYRREHEVQKAGKALAGRFFKPDKYNDRKAKAYWFKFQFPFWWSNLLTALDSLSLINFDRSDEDIQAALAWFSENQEPDGLWPTGYGVGRKAESNRRWVGLAVCRMLKRWYPG